MDEYEYCINTLMATSKMLEIMLTLDPDNKERHDKLYEDLVKWFKSTYELKRK